MVSVNLAISFHNRACNNVSDSRVCSWKVKGCSITNINNWMEVESLSGGCWVGTMVLYWSHVQLHSENHFAHLLTQVPPCFSAISSIQSLVCPCIQFTGAVLDPGKAQSPAGPSSVAFYWIGPVNQRPSPIFVSQGCPLQLTLKALEALPQFTLWLAFAPRIRGLLNLWLLWAGSQHYGWEKALMYVCSFLQWVRRILWRQHLWYFSSATRCWYG